MSWIIDNKIKLTEIVMDDDHLATCIDRLVNEGLSRRDAEAFANFGIDELSIEQGGVGSDEEYLTEEQFERLN
jgi:hypothetical protein